MRLGATLLFVTNDQIEATSMGDRVCVLNAGCIVQVGTPQEVYDQPKDVSVASFIGSPPMNIVDGELRDGRVFALFRQRKWCRPGLNWA